MVSKEIYAKTEEERPKPPSAQDLLDRLRAGRGEVREQTDTGLQQARKAAQQVFEFGFKIFGPELSKLPESSELKKIGLG
jgi:hypothetical protein